MHGTDLFIGNSADLEYTKKTFKLHGEWSEVNIYLKKNRN